MLVSNVGREEQEEEQTTTTSSTSEHFNFPSHSYKNIYTFFFSIHIHSHVSLVYNLTTAVSVDKNQFISNVCEVKFNKYFFPPPGEVNKEKIKSKKK